MNHIYRLVWDHLTGWKVVSEFGRSKKKSSPSRRGRALASAIIGLSAISSAYAVDYPNGLTVNAGELIEVTESQIQTQSDNAHGVVMEGNGLTLTNSDILTTGKNASGMWLSAGQTEMTGGHITVSNESSDGVTATSGASVSLIGTTIQVGGQKSYGVRASSGASVTLDGVTITNNSNSGNVGVFVKDQGTVGIIKDSHMIIGAAAGEGLLAADGGKLTATGGTIRGSFSNQAGIRAEGAQSWVQASGVDINLQGQFSMGATVAGDSKVILDGATITNSGDNGVGLSAVSKGPNSTFAPGGLIEANNTHITMTGKNSYGIQVSDGSRVEISGSRIDIDGQNALGVTIQALPTADHQSVEGPRMVMKQSTLSTKNDNGYGFFLTSYNTPNIAHLELQDVAIETEGNGAHGIISYGSDNIVKAERVNIHVKGQESSAFMMMVDSGASGEFSFKDSSLVSEQFAAFTVANATGSLISLTNSEVSSGSDELIYVMGNGSEAHLRADSSTLNGNVKLDAGSSIDMALTNGTQWNGAAERVDKLTMSDSLWNVKQDSYVGSLTANGATIALSAPAAGIFKTLSLGSLAGQNATFELNTVLNEGGSATESDRVHITDDADGNHSLVIHNAGGLGALTVGDGIQVVQIDGSATGGFTLGNTVSAGAYQYMLYQGGEADANDWYLRSYLMPTPPAPEPDPDPNPEPGVTPPAPKPKPQILYRPEVAGYVAAPYLNQQYGFDTIGSFQERKGDSTVTRKDSAWGRISGQRIDNESGRFNYKTDTWFVQLGSDIYDSISDSGTRAVGGLMMTLGRQNTDARDSVRRLSPLLSAKTGKVDSDGYGLGAYYSVSMANGAYIDVVGQGTYYRNDYSSDHNAKQNGYGAVTSIEAGHGFALGSGWSVQPQAQLMYQYLHLSDFNDGVSRVDGVSESSGRARGGLRIEKQMDSVKPYITMDVIHQLGDSPDVRVADTTVKSDFTDTWWRAGAGVSANLSDSVSVYGDLKYQKDTSSSADGYGGSFGIKVSF